MFQVDSADASVAETARTGLGTIGFFNDDVAGAGTVVSAEIMNAIMKELMGLVTVIGGLALDKADDTQLQTVLGAIRALVSSATDTTAVATDHSRVVIASTAGRAQGIATAAVACGTVNADGTRAAVIASGNASDASGTDCLTAASLASTNAGDTSAIVASDNSVISGGQNAVIIGSDGAAANGDQSMVAASDGDVDATGDQSACIACGTVVGGGIETSGISSAAIGVTGGIVVSGASSVCLASDFDTDAGAQSEPETVFGGDGNAITWRIVSTTGKASFEKLRVNEDLAIDAGEGTAVLDKVPTGYAAAQAKWLVIDIDGTDHVFPAWAV